MSLSVASLRSAYDAGELSPVDVVADSLSRATAPAFGFLAHDSAGEAAHRSSERYASGTARALEGVPIAVKDDTVVGDMPTTFGTHVLEPLVQAPDARFIGRLRDAGAIVVGKTALPEFGAIAVTEGGRYGTCPNPFDATRTAGGSSGGSAAAVASGMVPAATGSDGGGSLRIPASCCGLFTIKPTRGRLSVAPYGGESPLVTTGFLTSTVLDNALLLDVAAGADPADPFGVPAPARPYVEAVQVGARGGAPRLRVGFTASPPLDTPVDPACVSAVEDAAALCERLGHSVEPVTPDWFSTTAEKDFMQVWSVLIGSFAQWLVSQGGDIGRADPHNRELHRRALATPAPAYLSALSQLRLVVRRVMPLWNDYDVLLTPTLAQLPLPVGVLFDGTDDPIEPMMRAFGFTPFTPVVNVTGQPAVSMPLSSHDGLPVGVQAIGRFGEEATLLGLAAELEHASAWPSLRALSARAASGTSSDPHA